MPTRSRSFDGMMGVSGVYQQYGSYPETVIKSARVGDSGTCDDSTSSRPRPDQALLIKRSVVRYPTFNGELRNYDGSLYRTMSNCPADYQPGAPSPSAKFPPLTVFDQNGLAWESLAATNPNVPHVSLPSYWAELKDLPALFKSWGSSWLKEELPWRLAMLKSATSYKQFKQFLRTAVIPPSFMGKTRENMVKELFGLWSKGYINWRWAIKPMISDILKMFNFVDAVSQRFLWLDRLQSGKRVLKRKATLRNNTAQDPPSTAFVVTKGAFLTGVQRVSYTEKVWCVVKWRLDTSYNFFPTQITYEDSHSQWKTAQRLAAGLNTAAALQALWQIMPWSWFVDWFLHVSTIMDATNNTVPVTSSDTCLMRETEAIRTVTLNDSGIGDYAWCKPTGPNRQSQVWKQRLIVNPILPFAPTFVPVFTGSQLSILGSLAVLRLANLKVVKI